MPINVDTIFSRPSWVHDLKEAVSGNGEFVRVLRSHPELFKKSLMSSLEKSEVANLLDSRITVLHELYEICHDGGDTAVLSTVVEEADLQPLLPAIFARKQSGQTITELFQKTLPLMSVITSNLGEVALKIKRNGWAKVSKKVSHLGWTLYFLRMKNTIALYAQGDPLGEGVFKKARTLMPLAGNVFLALLKGVKGNEVDWKNTVKNALYKDAFISDILRKQNVPYVPYIKTVKNNVLNIMELCTEGDLKKFLGNYEKTVDRMPFLIQLLEMLDGMHQNNWCHLDLKFPNILATKKITESREIVFELRPCDFGSSEEIKKGSVIDLCSSYPAPENVIRYFKDELTDVHPALDLWALGDLMHQFKYKKSLLFQYQLFARTVIKDKELQDKEKELKAQLLVNSSDENKKLIEEKIQEAQKGVFYLQQLEALQKYLVATFDDSKDGYDQCMVRLLSVDPKERPSAREVKEVISAWVKNQ